MRDRPLDPPPISISVQLYRLFLVLYPTAFRREYGGHMLQVFRDYSLRTYDRRGPAGMLLLWTLTLLDLLRSVVEQHLERETFMSQNTLVRLGGRAMMIGGVACGIAFLTIFGDASGLLSTPNGGTWMALLVAAFSYGPVGVGLGLLSIRARYGRSVGGLGDAALLLGAFIGTLLIVIGAIVKGVLSNRLYDSGFFTIAIGLFVLFGTLNLYGILALIHKPQPRWNGLGLAAGLPITLAATVSVSLAAAGRLGVNWAERIPGPLAAAYILSFVVMGGALVMLGYLVQTDLPAEIAAERAGA